LNQPGKSPDFSAEELMAVFSLEQKRLDQAESWFLKAADLMPDSFRPRLFLADLALVRQDKEKAEEWLKAARDLQAPQAELDRRETVLKTGLPAPNAVPDSGVPVPALPASPNTGASPGVPMRTLIE
jgi:tetratricopeptide (TPR) repeat protein